MNREDETMIDSIKMIFIMGFPQFLMIDMNGVQVLWTPFPN